MYMPEPEVKPGEVVADSARFDRSIRLLVPRYEELHQAVLWSIPPDFKGSLRILELGCGTGELTQKLLERYPYARVYAVDYSAKMLAVARKKLAAAVGEGRLQFIEGDFNRVDLPSQLDLAVSTLAVHHLTDPQKLELFRRLHARLRRGGWFVNGDAVLFESVHHEFLHDLLRREHASQSGLSLEDLAGELADGSGGGDGGGGEGEGKGKGKGGDHPTTLMNQLNLLRAAGFSVVDVIWKYYSLAVYGGFKDKLPQLPDDPSSTFAY